MPRKQSALPDAAKRSTTKTSSAKAAPSKSAKNGADKRSTPTDKLQKLLIQGRKAQDLSGQELAVKVFGKTVSRQYYSQLERGCPENPSKASVPYPKCLKRMASILDIPYEKMVDAAVERIAARARYSYTKGS